MCFVKDSLLLGWVIDISRASLIIKMVAYNVIIIYLYDKAMKLILKELTLIHFNVCIIFIFESKAFLLAKIKLAFVDYSIFLVFKDSKLMISVVFEHSLIHVLILL